MATVIFVCKRKSFHSKWIRIFSCSSTHLLIDRCGLDIFPRLHERHPGLYPRLTSITIWQTEAEIKKWVSNFQIKTLDDKNYRKFRESKQCQMTCAEINKFHINVFSNSSQQKCIKKLRFF